MALLDEYLKQNGTNRAQVAEALEVAPSTFQRAAKANDAAHISSRVKGLIAKALFTTPAKVEEGMAALADKPDKKPFDGNLYIAHDQITATWFGKGATSGEGTVLAGCLFRVKRLSHDEKEAIVDVERDQWHNEWHIPLVELATSATELSAREYNAVRTVVNMGLKVEV